MLKASVWTRRALMACIFGLLFHSASPALAWCLHGEAGSPHITSAYADCEHTTPGGDHVDTDGDALKSIAPLAVVPTPTPVLVRIEPQHTVSVQGLAAPPGHGLDRLAGTTTHLLI